ncbi:hypothetical protein KOI35_32375 [Actinoplanes bogorensis]|uniref:Uncharacterized protein n=1 Tax=Paractinoplanes bogorensis TaxID=1610840 RepID=A0ABS5YXQ2_9ACTN|nr:hypothetical protein [Actinoplanes bogorensis]MBU2668218.1 hypothetical protein [Actinoplanes bogorensis]
MASIADRIRQFLRSPKGQQLVNRAQAEMRKPENKRRLSQLSNRAQQEMRKPENQRRLSQLAARLRGRK